MVSYKLVTYERTRKPRAGIVVEDKLFDAAEVTGKSRYATMLNILNDWEPAQLILETGVVKAKDGKIQGVPLEQARLLAPLLYPSAIFCAGANYVDHLEEMNAALKMNVNPDPRSLGLDPWHFLKAPRSVVGRNLSSSFLPTPNGRLGKPSWQRSLAVRQKIFPW